jgi:hypothetical protein
MISLYWHMPNFGRRIYFGCILIWKKIFIFGACTLGGRKAAWRKRSKSSMQEEKQCGVHADKPNHVRVRVFDKYCNGYKPLK